jgi:hypothetical protein
MLVSGSPLKTDLPVRILNRIAYFLKPSVAQKTKKSRLALPHGN